MGSVRGVLASHPGVVASRTELTEMRRLLSRWGLRQYTKQLEHTCGCQTIDDLLDIRRPQLEKVPLSGVSH